MSEHDGGLNEPVDGLTQNDPWAPRAAAEEDLDEGAMEEDPDIADEFFNSQCNMPDNKTGRPKSSLGAVKIEEFHGGHDPKRYKRWKKAVLALFRLYNLEESELAMLVYLACRGEARVTLNILEIDEMMAPHGMEMIWELLDEAFDKLVFEKYEEASAEYNEVYRKYGMSMDQYITGLKRAKRELLSQDQKSVISDKAFAQKMLKNSNIGHDNRMQVFFNAGSKYRSERIEAEGARERPKAWQDIQVHEDAEGPLHGEAGGGRRHGRRCRAGSRRRKVRRRRCWRR